MKKTFIHKSFVLKMLFIVNAFCMSIVLFSACQHNNNTINSFEETKTGNYQGLNSVEAIYGMASVTTSELLSFQGQDTTVLSKTRNEMTNEDYQLPESGSNSVIQAQDQAENFNRYFNMLNEFLDKKSISTTIEQNKETKEPLSTYQFKLTVEGEDINGDKVTHVMYYSEEALPVRQEKDDDEVETYKGYTITGLMEIGVDQNNNPIYYYVSGQRTETRSEEKREVEISNEFYVRASIEKNDRLNYVEMKYENETEQEGQYIESENSYLYSIYEQGRIIEQTEISFEDENNEKEYEIEFITGTSRGYYEIERVKRNNSTWIEVEYNIDRNQGKFVIIENNDGTYDYKFSKNTSDDRLFKHYDD